MAHVVLRWLHGCPAVSLSAARAGMAGISGASAGGKPQPSTSPSSICIHASGLVVGALRVLRHVRDGLAKDAHAGVDLVSGDDERRAQADDVVAGLEHEQAAREARPLDGLRGVARVELDADHQALAAHVAHEPGMLRPSAAANRPAPARRAPRRCPSALPAAARSSRAPRRTKRRCRRTSSRGGPCSSS